MQIVNSSGPLQGIITVPADKSITHRAIIFSSLADGDSRIKNPLRAEDCMSTLKAFRMMGVEVKDTGEDEEIIIHGSGLDGLKESEDVIDCGNSGTTARLLCGLLSGQPFFSVLTGDTSLRQRPMDRVTAPLSSMGAKFYGRSKGRFLPMAIQGSSALKAMSYVSPVASAQVKTSILLAGLFCDGVTEIVEPGKSRDHTERMLPAYGVNLEVDGFSVRLSGRPQLRGQDITVPGDISSAAFFIVAALILPGSDIVIENVGVNPTRTGILDILKNMEADIGILNKREVSGEPVADIHVRYSALKGVSIQGDVIPRAIDEFPAICVAAALAEGETSISGVAELRVKESDRISSMAEGLRSMGVIVDELPEGMVISGQERLLPGVFHSRGDHRIAMAMAVAALKAEGESKIKDAGCIATSYPGFWKTLKTLQRSG